MTWPRVEMPNCTLENRLSRVPTWIAGKGDIGAPAIIVFDLSMRNAGPLEDFFP